MAQHSIGDEKVNIETVENSHTSEKALDTAEIERVMSPDDLKKDGQNYGRMDVGGHPHAIAHHGILSKKTG